jgi:integrase
MPRLAKSLTEFQVKSAKPKDKPYTLADGNGLYLAVSVAGRKSWTVRYKLAGSKTHTPATVGHYPAMTLLEARASAVEVNRDAKRGIATAGTRKAAMMAAATEEAEQAAEHRTQESTRQASFRAVSGRWLAERRPTWSYETYRKARLVVDSHFMPKLSDADMRTLVTQDIRPVLLDMHRKVPALAKKARQYIAGIVDQAINEGLRSDESTLRLNRILPANTRSGHMPAITDDSDGGLADVLRAIDGYGNRVVRAALILTTLTVVRPGVIASARWSEIDLETGTWRIPGFNEDGRNRMKTGKDFTTALPRQALEVLREMYQRTAGTEYVFPPQARQQSAHLNRDSLSSALRDLGFQGKQTPHGFRATLRTVGRERLDIEVDVLEAQLAHAPKNEVDAAYARTQFREKRREIMQRWADYLDELRTGSNVVPLKRQA